MRSLNKKSVRFISFVAICGMLKIGIIGCGQRTINLVPEEPAQTPNYWCTWGA